MRLRCCRPMSGSSFWMALRQSGYSENTSTARGGKAVELCGWAREKEEETDGHSTHAGRPRLQTGNGVTEHTPPVSGLSLLPHASMLLATLVGRLTLLFRVLVSQDVNHRLRLQCSECSGQAAEVTIQSGCTALTIDPCREPQPCSHALRQ